MELELTKLTETKNESSFILSKNLKELLKKFNLNPTQLGTILNIPAMTVTRLLSGETTDPRISTIKPIADYFKTTIDSLISPNLIPLPKELKPHFIPLIEWDTFNKIKSIQDLNLVTWQNWQAIPPTEDDNPLSSAAFALMSRPAMYPRYPNGSVFVIDPLATPEDGNIVLVKIKTNNELTLREIYFDPPDKLLQPLTKGSGTLLYNSKDHEIIGVNQLIMMYNKK